MQCTVHKRILEPVSRERKGRCHEPKGFIMMNVIAFSVSARFDLVEFFEELAQEREEREERERYEEMRNSFSPYAEILDREEYRAALEWEAEHLGPAF